MSKHLPPKKNKHEKAEKPSILNISLRQKKTIHSKNELTELSRKNIARTSAAALVLILGLALPIDGWVSIAVFAVALLIAGFQVIVKAADEAMKIQLLESELLILVAAIAAFATGAYAGAALLMICYRVGKLVEGWADKNVRSQSEAFRAFLPKSAVIVSDHGPEEVEPDAVAEDDILEVKAGEVFPVDGYVLEGLSAMDASPITGISAGRTIGVGSSVYSGCINLSGTVKMKAERIYAESSAYIISQLLERANRFKSRGEKLSAKIERYFTPVIVVLAFVTSIVMPVFKGDWMDWIGRGAAILALSGCGFLPKAISNACTCAVVWAIRRGIVFKGHSFLETLGTAQTFIFNKTGTLTEGRYVVTEIVPDGMSSSEFLAMAAHVESVSDHPIARAICWAYGSEAGKGLRISAEEIEGRGLVAKVNDTEVILGNAVLLGEYGIDCPVTPKGATAIHMSISGKYAGYMVLVDKIRENAFDQLESLRAHGVKNLVTLTSDLHSVARPLASSLNMEMVRAELSAEAKVSAVEYLMATKAEHSTLAFVCDGAGDPETLTRADVGISFDALGHSEAYDRADVLITEARLGALADTVGISSRALRAELISLGAFALVKLVAVIAAYTGFVGISVIALADLALSAFLYVQSLNVINYNDIRRIKR